MRRLLNLPESHRSILVADHDPDERSTLVRSLEPVGFSIYEAEAGREVINLARKRLVDILIMEMDLPDLDGVHTLRIVNDLVGPIPCIFVANEVSKETWMNALSAHAFALLRAPLRAELVRRTVWDLVRQRFGPPPQ
jgi:CheY-like chemotaxis protein